LSSFQKMLVIKALREELGMNSVSDFVEGSMGKMYIAPPSTSMEDLYKDLDAATPCIFVLSTGADPTQMLLRFAESMKYSERISLISLGQGQGPRAEALISSGTQTGNWVLLQNCHLAKSWMNSLERVCLNLVEKQKNPEEEGPLNANFRLWLTSFPAAYFPVPILQGSVKLTNEPPRGMRANMLRTFDLQLSDNLLDSSQKPDEFRKLICALTFFHGILQERRKFGPLGWNITYGFNDSDMETAIAVLCRFLDEQETTPWDALVYVIGHINYGGRVTDDWDRRCLMTILHKFYNPKVLEEGYTFSSSGKYFAPPSGNFADYKAYLEALPQQDNPEIFGMHSNANITYMMQETSTMFGTILALQPRDAGGEGGQSPDEVVVGIAQSIQKGLPEILDRDLAGETTFTVRANGQMDSLATVLGQELVKFNRLLNRVVTSLVSLQKAIKGLVVMSLDLDKMYTSFQRNQVPEIWEKVGFASLKPLASWVLDMQGRFDFLRAWLLQGQPDTFAMPVFFFPQGFLTGVLQNHARKYGIPINALDFRFEVQQEPVEKIAGPEDGVVVYGLFMEGARYDPSCSRVVDSLPAQMYSVMPAIHFIPQENYVRSEEEYACPCYKTSLRQGVLSTTGISTNFVIGVDLPSERIPEECVLQGVAFLLNLND